MTSDIQLILDALHRDRTDIEHYSHFTLSAMDGSVMCSNQSSCEKILPCANTPLFLAIGALEEDICYPQRTIKDMQ